MSDIVIRGGILVIEGLPQSDISIENGRIEAIGPDLPGAA
jgi:dihydroorotase-like cyclic amidohydrolase